MKILFLHQGLKSYVQTDLDILCSVYDVRECYFPGVRKYGILSLWYVPGLLQGVLWCDLVFSWFGKFHAFLAVAMARCFGKKSVVVVSGGEVCRFTLGPGKLYNSICTHPVKKWFPKFVARYADLLLPVSDYAYSEATQSVRPDLGRMRRIHHGFDMNFFKKKPGQHKRTLVLTVTELLKDNYYRKRLGVILEVARLLPNIPFVIVGHDYDGTGARLQKIAPRNVRFTGRISDEELVDILGRASVYIQPSIMESFGCALAEAMLCECVPVVSRTTVLPEVVGDCGIYLDEPVTQEEIATKIQVALQHSDLGRRARQRVIDNFSLERRRKELLDAVASLERRII